MKQFFENLIDKLNEDYEIMLMKFDSNVLFPLRVTYKRNKKEIQFLGTIVIILLIILILFEKFNN